MPCIIYKEECAFMIPEENAYKTKLFITVTYYDFLKNSLGRIRIKNIVAASLFH